MADPRSEPSMEDILASIKRIIADDPAPLPQSPVPGAQGAPLSPPVFDRVSPVASPARPAAESRTAEPPRPWPPHTEAKPPESILELTDRMPEPPPPRTAAPPPPEPSAPVQRAVERLRQAEAEMPQPAPRPVPRDLLPRTPTPRATGGDITLEALAREMLQPMLADWIEKNLPDMVERLVQAEIRRMSERDG